MASQGSRRGTLYPQQGGGATILPHRQEDRAAGPPSLPAKDETVRIREDLSYRPSLTRKKAIHDFRVRWPDLTVLDQKKKEELPLTGLSLSELLPVPSTCSSMLSITNTDLESTPSELLDSEGQLAGDSQEPPSQTPQMTILNRYLKPESLTRLEKKVRRKTLEAMTELEQEKEAVRRRRSVLMKDIKDMQKDILYEKAQSKIFLEYLQQKTEEKERKYDSLWKDYTQQCGEIEDRRRELVSTFTSRTAHLQKQLLRGRTLEASLRRKLKALEPIAQEKESQEQKIQALELEEASIVADISLLDQEAHLQFLKERAVLEKQLEDLNLLESGEDITRELKKKAQDLDSVVKQAHDDFWEGIKAGKRQLQTQLQQLDREFCKLEAGKKKLEQQKQRWKEQQWYLEALVRGRERLRKQEHQQHRRQLQKHCRQQQENHHHRPQTAPQPALGRLLSARPKANPK